MTENTKPARIEYLTARQLAEILQVSESTIHRLRHTGKIPFLKISDRLIRFNMKEVRHALRPHQEELESGARGHSHQEEPDPQLSFGDIYEEFDK